MLWFWIFVGPATLLGALALRGERKRAEYVTAGMSELDEPPARALPPVSVIVPIGAETADLAATLRSLAAQDYPDFELIVVAPNADSVPADALPRAVKVAMAGECASLLHAGVKSARPRSEVYAFAGGVVHPFWLRALVSPLSEPNVGATTGFRWYTPDPPTFWSLIRSVWNGVVAGKLASADSDFAWAGSMAIFKTIFLEARVSEYWTDPGREDFALARAIRAARKRIVFAPGAMVAYRERPTAGEFFRQARHEMAEARLYLPRLWWTGLLAHAIYCGAMLAAIIAIAHGSRGAEWALVVQFGLGMLKGVNRATLAKAELPKYKTWFDRYSWTHTFWTPIATWVWLYVLLSSLLPI